MAATFLASPIPGDASLPPSPRHLPSRGTNMPVFTEFSRSLEKHVPVYRAKFSANGRMKIAGCFRCKFHRLFIRGYPVKTLFPVTRLNKRLICMRVEWGDPLGVETEKRQRNDAVQSSCLSIVFRTFVSRKNEGGEF